MPPALRSVTVLAAVAVALKTVQRQRKALGLDLACRKHKAGRLYIEDEAKLKQLRRSFQRPYYKQSAW